MINMEENKPQTPLVMPTMGRDKITPAESSFILHFRGFLPDLHRLPGHLKILCQ